MPFGFLGQLASGIGKGAKFLGGGIKSGVKKLGELGQMEGGDAGAASGGIFPQLKRPVPMTPGINPNAPMPDLQGGKGGMFAKGIDLINRQQPQPNAMPELRRPSSIPTTGNPLTDIEAIERSQRQLSPSNMIGDMERLSSQVNANNREGRQGLLQMPEAQTQLIPERPLPTVRVPDFLGTPGATKEDTPLNRREYEYQTQYMKDGKIPRRWQDIAMNALQGAAQGFQLSGNLGGALGGAIAGGAGSAISPLHARAFRFNAEQRPRLMADQAENERMQDRGFEQQKRNATLGNIQADTDYRSAQIRRINEPAPPMGYADASWGTYDRATGKPEYIRPQGQTSTAAPRRYRVGDDLVDETGKVIYQGKPSANRPVSVAPGSTLIDPTTGKEIYKAPPRSAGMSKEAQKALQEVNSQKQQAMQLWEQSKRATDPAQKAQLEEKARLAQYAYNEAALGLAEVYPEDFEAGEGEGGWNYTKPIGSTPQIQRRGQGAQGGTAKLSDLKKLLQ